jgi:hypothetical protein
VLGGGAFEGFARGEDAEADFEVRRPFALRAEEGAVHLSDPDFVHGGGTWEPFAMLEDGGVVDVFLSDEAMAGLRDSPREGAMIQGGVEVLAEQRGGLPIGDARGQGHCLGVDPGADMLVRVQAEHVIEGYR